MRIAFTLCVLITLTSAADTYAEEIGRLSISGQVVESSLMPPPDGQRTIQRGASTQTVALPGDGNHRIIITAWD